MEVHEVLLVLAAPFPSEEPPALLCQSATHVLMRKLLDFLRLLFSQTKLVVLLHS